MHVLTEGWPLGLQLALSIGLRGGDASAGVWGMAVLGGALQGQLVTLLLANLAMWLISMGFTIRENIWLLAIGTLGYLALIPVAEAAEQTVLQKVVPFERQGRVFGLAQSVEVASAPVSAFIIGPVAEFWLIPFTNSDAGRAQWGWLLGDGQARGIALVFLLAGLAGLALTLFAFTTRSYRWLSARYAEPSDTPAAEPDDASTTAG